MTTARDNARVEAANVRAEYEKVLADQKSGFEQAIAELKQKLAVAEATTMPEWFICSLPLG